MKTIAPRHAAPLALFTRARPLVAGLVIAGVVGGSACATSKARVISSRIEKKYERENLSLIVLPTKCTSVTRNLLTGSDYCEGVDLRRFDSDLQRSLDRTGHTGLLARDIVASLIERDHAEGGLSAYATWLGLAGAEGSMSRSSGSRFVDASPKIRQQLIDDVEAEGVAEMTVDVVGVDRTWGGITVNVAVRIGLGAYRKEPLAYVECEAAGSDMSDALGKALRCVRSKLKR